MRGFAENEKELAIQVDCQLLFNALSLFIWIASGHSF